MIGRVGGESYSGECSANFLRLVDSTSVCTSMLHLEDSVSYDNLKTGVAFSENDENAGERIVTDGSCMEPESDTKRLEQPLLQDEIALHAQNEELNQQLERLWKTDFENSEVETRVSASVEDKRALEVMERTLKMVDGHYQVALPWRYDPPYLPNNRVVAEQTGLLLKKRLLRDEAMPEKYKATMTDYIEKGHAEMIPEEELELNDRPVWYLPHHPVTHPLKPDKVRVVHDCAAKYGGTSILGRVMCSDFCGGPTEIYLEKWKSIEWLNICSGPHLHPVLPTSACRRPQNCTEGNLKQTR